MPGVAVTAAVWAPRRWRPRSRPGAASGAEKADAWLTHGDGLLAQLAGLGRDDSRSAVVRARVIEWYLPMSVYLAYRFKGRGEPVDDLCQVAVIGLIKAVDRFDVQRGVPFAAYATPTILGELKRHFRDRAWNVRVPRRLQELKLQLPAATEDLTHVLHRPPTAAELAARLSVSRADVVAAQQCESAYRPLSLQQPSSEGEGEGRYLVDSLGCVDPAIAAVDVRETLRRRLAELPARERRIIALRFFAEMTQAQIAVDVGVSQMQVSRLLARGLARLRDATWPDLPAPAGAPR